VVTYSRSDDEVAGVTRRASYNDVPVRLDAKRIRYIRFQSDPCNNAPFGSKGLIDTSISIDPDCSESGM
jgi:hypothetical protein